MLRVSLFIVISVTVIGCNSKKKKALAQKNYAAKMANSAKNLFDWNGVYRGMMPCDDCEGIQTEITLIKNNTYELAKRHEGKNTEILVEKGSFRWSMDGNKITFYSANNTTEYANYVIGENQLTKVDNNGNKILDEYSEMYVLKKKGYDDRIAEKYWLLIELNGKVLEPTKHIQQMHVMLKLKDSKVYGYGGCNRFSGHFELLDGNRIVFTKMLNSLITCKNNEQERAFLQVFELANTYAIHNDTLSLTKSRMPSMAKFKAVYMR
jgi:heat shock protein HslJ/uncharacterized lipoprotein NlpE involved in copper resistance